MTNRLRSAAALYLAAQRWSPGPTWLNSRWRSAGGTWCEHRHGNRGSEHRQSHSSAARSRPPPLCPGQHRRAERRASKIHSVRKLKPKVQFLTAHESWELYTERIKLIKLKVQSHLISTYYSSNACVPVFTLSVSAVDRGWYLRRRALATWRQEQLNCLAVSEN